MRFQDYIFTSGSIIFIIALIPMLINKAKPPLKSSITIGTILLSYAVMYMSLGLTFGSISTSLQGACWFILTIQAMHARRKRAKILRTINQGD